MYHCQLFDLFFIRLAVGPALLALSLLSAQPILANQKLPERLRTTLVAPICIGDSSDGQKFALKIDNDDLSLPVEYDAKLLGHLRLVTPDSRATKNQFVELVIDKLSTKDRSFPVEARFEISGKTLIIKNNSKTSTIPIERCDQPVRLLGGLISHCSPISKSELRKEERMALTKQAEMKLSAIKDRRYGFNHAGQMVFLSTKANPFNLPVGQPFRVILSREIEI